MKVLFSILFYLFLLNSNCLAQDSTQIPLAESYLNFEKEKQVLLVSNLDSLLTVFQLLIEKDSSISHHYFNIGNIYRAKEMYNEAIFYYSKSIELDGRNFDYFAYRGMLNYENDSTNLACNDFYSALDLVGVIKNYKQKEIDVREFVIATCGDTSGADYVELALNSLDSLEVEESIGFCREGLKRDPENPILLNCLANCLIQTRQYGEANKYYFKSVKYQNNLYKYFVFYNKANEYKKLLLANNYSGLGYSYCELTKLDSGLYFLKASSKIYKHLKNINVKFQISQNYNMIGQVYMMQEKYLAAENQFYMGSVTLAVNPDSYFNRAILLLHKKNLVQKNKRIFDYGAEIQLGDGIILLGSTERIKGEYALERALEYCDKVIRLDENYSSAYVLRAQIKKILLKDPCEDAKKAFELGVYEVYNHLGLDDCAE